MDVTKQMYSLVCCGWITDDVVLAAEDLRYAANAIGKITGAIDVEDVLDVVFREFCIGK